MLCSVNWCHGPNAECRSYTLQTLSFKTNDKDDIRFVEKLQQWFLSEATDPSKLVGSAEHAASAGSGASASASGARSPAGVAQSDKRAAPHSTKRSTISGAQRRKAHRAALKAGTAQPSEAEQRRALRKAASRSRKRERRETKRMLAAAGSGPALPAMIPTTTSR